MSKPVKDLITRELAGRYEGVESALWIELLGIDGITTNAFRGELRSRQMRLEIVKNSLFRRACGDGPLAKLAGALDGPAAIATGGESLIDVAKLIDEWRPKMKGLRLRGAVLEGEYIGETEVSGLSKMPSRRDLQARIVGQALSPGANLAAAALGPGSVLAGCVKALIEKLEKAEAPAAA